VTNAEAKEVCSRRDNPRRERTVTKLGNASKRDNNAGLKTESIEYASCSKDPLLLF